MSAIEAREKHVLWRIKGLSSQLTYRIFNFYGNPACVEEDASTFSKYIRDNFAVQLLESHLNTIFKKKNFFVSSKSLNVAIRFVCQATKLPTTMKILKPYIENLLFEVLIPILLVTHKDVVLMKEDPIEFIRKQ